MAVVLTAKAQAKIIALGHSRAPHEACGILLARPPPDVEPIVIEVPNTSLNPESSYEFTSEKAQEAAEEFLAAGVVVDDVMVWHTHPSGRSGPSTKDLETRIPSVKYIVCTLDGDCQRY